MIRCSVGVSVTSQTSGDARAAAARRRAHVSSSRVGVRAIRMPRAAPAWAHAIARRRADPAAGAGD